MAQRRFDGLDMLKTLAMLCVCLYHFYWGPAISYETSLTLPGMALRALRALDAVCVPLFMMVNGALMLNRPLDVKRHAKRCLWLFCGMLFWYLLTQVIVHACRDGLSYVAANMKGILLSAQYLYEYDGVVLDHFWFMQTLLAIYVLLPLVKPAFDSRELSGRKGLAFSMAVLTLLCFLPNDFRHIKPLLAPLRWLDLSALDSFSPVKGRTGAMLVYFLLGGAMQRQREKLQKISVVQSLEVFFVGWLALFCEGYIMTRANHAVYDVVYNGYCCLPTGMMCTGLFMLAICLDAGEGSLPLRRFCRFVGRNTLSVYYTHWILGLCVLPLLPVPMGSVAANVFKAVVQLASGALLGEGMRRIPFLRKMI